MAGLIACIVEVALVLSLFTSMRMATYMHAFALSHEYAPYLVVSSGVNFHVQNTLSLS